MADRQISESENVAPSSNPDLFHSIMSHEGQLFSNVVSGKATASEYVEAVGQVVAVAGLGAGGIMSIEKMVGSGATKAATTVIGEAAAGKQVVGIIGLGGEMPEVDSMLKGLRVTHAESLENGSLISIKVGAPDDSFARGIDAFIKNPDLGMSRSVGYGGPYSAADMERWRRAFIKGQSLNGIEVKAAE